jgi:hypothetical protein
MVPIPIDAVSHRPAERGQGPSADTRSRIRCDVGGEDSAKRRGDASTTRVGTAIPGGVTHGAIAQCGKPGTAGDVWGGEGRPAWWAGGWDLRRGTRGFSPRGRDEENDATGRPDRCRQSA